MSLLDTPTFDDLQIELTKAKSTFGPAETHGLICGALCRLSHDNQWIDWVRGTTHSSALDAQLQMLFASTEQQMQDFAFEFQLLLPDDEIDINVRAEALGLWCQGFLTGLSSDDAESFADNPEMVDALKDIVEISQVSYEDIPGNEDDETAYFELAEYIRLVALMVYQERHESVVNTDIDKNALH